MGWPQALPFVVRHAVALRRAQSRLAVLQRRPAPDADRKDRHRAARFAHGPIPRSRLTFIPAISPSPVASCRLMVSPLSLVSAPDAGVDGRADEFRLASWPCIQADGTASHARQCSPRFADDWIRHSRQSSSAVLRVERAIVARRLISWLSPLLRILDGADPNSRAAL